MKNLTWRNFLGGFLGGVLGTICFHLIHEFLLPVGCIVGVVAGFWYKEIFSYTKYLFEDSLIIWIPINSLYLLGTFVFEAFKQIIQFIFRLSKTFKTAFQDLAHLLGKPNSERLKPKAGKTALDWIGVFTIATSILLMGLLEYLYYQVVVSVQPMIRSQATEMLALLVIILTFIFPLVLFFLVLTNLFHSQGEVCKSLSIRMDNLKLVVDWEENEDLRELNSYYSRLEEYSKHGFVFSVILKTLKHFGVMVLILLAVYGWLLLGLAFVLFLYLPLIIGYSIVRAIISFSTSKEHWPCLITTLIVTIIGAVYSPFGLQGLQLWLVALAVGCVSGLAAAGIHLAFKKAIKQLDQIYPLVGMKLDYYLEPLNTWRVGILRKIISTSPTVLN